jgi:hypothetical protein
LKPSKNAIISRDFSGIGSDSIPVALVADLPDSDRQVLREVVVEPLTGKDEQWLNRCSPGGNLPQWVTRLLGDKVLWRGKPIGAEEAARLSVVDRDLLILYLRMLTFGRQIWGITHCPQAPCDAKLDFTFDLSTIKLPPDPVQSPITTWAGSGDERIDFSFRQPNGLDQEAIADLVFSDPYQAWLTLLSRCIVKWESLDTVTAELLGDLPRELLRNVDQTMAAETGSLDWDIEFTCVECEHRFVTALDIQSYFWQELQFASQNLWEEVHHLAAFYHWSEADILSLTRWKRKLYLGIINQQRRYQ